MVCLIETMTVNPFLILASPLDAVSLRRSRRRVILKRLGLGISSVIMPLGVLLHPISRLRQACIPVVFGDLPEMVCLIEATTVSPFLIRASPLDAVIASRMTSKR
jgi:hypothetical protein